MSCRETRHEKLTFESVTYANMYERDMIFVPGVISKVSVHDLQLRFADSQDRLRTNFLSPLYKNNLEFYCIELNISSGHKLFK